MFPNAKKCLAAALFAMCAFMAVSAANAQEFHPTYPSRNLPVDNDYHFHGDVKYSDSDRINNLPPPAHTYYAGPGPVGYQNSAPCPPGRNLPVSPNYHRQGDRMYDECDDRAGMPQYQIQINIPTRRSLHNPKRNIPVSNDYHRFGDDLYDQKDLEKLRAQGLY